MYTKTPNHHMIPHQVSISDGDKGRSFINYVKLTWEKR